jgi:hypothetical protein
MANEELVGFHSSDIDSNGKDDLVWLQQTGPRSGRITVALSDGTSYGGEQVWFDGNMIVPLSGARLLVGDFQADGRPDVAVLAKGEEDGSAELVVLRNKPGGGFVRPGRWWSGPQDMATVAAAWAGDVSGDGRADLIVRQNPDGGGIRLKTAITKSPPPPGAERMNALNVGFELPGLDPAKVKTIPADADRDGREDVLMLVGSGGQARVERLQGQALGDFARVPLWTAPRSDSIPVEKSRLGAADVDYDGMTDLVIFSRHPNGTRIRVLKSRYGTMRPGPDTVEPIEWTSLRPY